MEKEFNINTKSVVNFLTENLVSEKSDMDKHHGTPLMSVYHLMKDDIYLKKSSGIKPQTVVNITLEDISQHSQKSLLNVYTYYAKEYDSASVQLVLMSYETKIK